ncbi:MAG: flagellar hook-associated protein FlgK [Alphaproteobacteria bacterium]|nr:MAG: flagellar hook-associated protein FlgK [Alphaproteobacteria bacterium]
MSLNGVLQTALTGLFTNQSALRTTSSNIANVNTPGYARQVVRQEPIIAGSTPAGVKLADVERIVDRFLEASALSSGADASRYSIERRFHDRIQALLGRPDQNNSLSGRLDTLFQKLGAVAQDPTKLVLRQDALSSIQDFANEISRLASEVQRLRADASNQISERISNINKTIERIDSLNGVIIQENVAGRQTGALEEQRAQALTALSEMIDIRVHQQGDGSVHVTTEDGTVLLGGARVELRYSAPALVTSETRFSPITAHNVDPTSGAIDPNGKPIDATIQAGELKGLLTLRDETLPDMARELGNLGAMVMDAINAVHNDNAAFPAPNTLTGRNTGLLSTDLHGFTGNAAFAVTDASGAVVARADIDFDALAPGTTIGGVVAAINASLGGAGTVSLSNGVLSFAATDPTHGVLVAQDPADPSSRGGRSFSQFFGLNDLLEAQVPGTYDTGFAGTDNHGFTPGGTVSFEVVGADNQVVASYTHTIAAGDFNAILADLNGAGALGTYFTFALDGNGALQVTPKPGFDKLSIHVKSDSTARGGSAMTFSKLFGVGERYLADAAVDMQVRKVVADNPEQLALGIFDYGAAVGQLALAAGDNEGGQALHALELALQSFDATGKLGAFNGTLAQYGAAILANMGLVAEQVTSRETDSMALAQEISRRRADVSGVNIDEELSNMVIYQNAYNASARIISTVRELYDTLLTLV